MTYYPADVRLEPLGEHAACFERDSGMTHIMDAGASFILQRVVAQPGVNRDALLAQLMTSFEDDIDALAAFLDEALALLLREGILRSSASLHADR